MLNVIMLSVVALHSVFKNDNCFYAKCIMNCHVECNYAEYFKAYCDQPIIIETTRCVSKTTLLKQFIIKDKMQRVFMCEENRGGENQIAERQRVCARDRMCRREL